MSDGVLDGRDRIAGYLPSEETRLGYLFWLSRPRFWLYLGGPVIVGATYAASTLGELFTPLNVALLAFFTVPANVFLYGINDAFDVDIDEVNPKKEDKEVQFRDDIWVMMIVIFSGVTGGLFIFVIPPLASQVLAAWYLLAVEYSAPPLRFKTKPFLDSVSNGLYVLPGVVAFTAVAGELPPAMAVVGGWLWTMGMHTFSAIPDIPTARPASGRPRPSSASGAPTPTVL
jgi:4-hydroxybenzoate polyprenyltransferase